MTSPRTDCLTRHLNLHPTGDPSTPYRTRCSGHELTIQLGEFPEGPLYVLVIDGVPVDEFDDWPANWHRP